MNETSYSKNPELVYGLSKEEVESRISQGFVNTNTDVKTKSIPQIISLHLFTLFNAVNLGLAFLVLTTGQFRNLLFIIIVALNLVVGIFQEIRSKLAIDKLSILTSSKVRTLRDGEVVEVATEDLVLGDCILLRHGEQVPADAKVVQGHLRMDESLLTGESRAIEKGCGQMLMSGSFVETGSCVAEIITVGSEGYAARINAQAKFEKPIYSEILATLKGIIKFSTCALIPLGIILFVRTYTHTHMYDRAILSTVAAVVAMIPQGLVLLTSSVMAIASTRLAGKHVLVQQMYCIETLARVNCVCLDKTGTITSGAMEDISI